MANKSRLAERNVGNTTCTSVRAACLPQLSFLLTDQTKDNAHRLENLRTGGESNLAEAASNFGTI